MVVKICFMDPIYQLKHQNLHLWTVGPFCPYKTWPGCLSFTLPDNLRAFFPVPFPKATSNIRAVLVSPDQVALFFLTRCRKRKFLQKFTQCDLVASKSNKLAHARVCVWVGGWGASLCSLYARTCLVILSTGVRVGSMDGKMLFS
jgi:hypothetical protein